MCSPTESGGDGAGGRPPSGNRTGDGCSTGGPALPPPTPLLLLIVLVVVLRPPRLSGEVDTPGARLITEGREVVGTLQLGGGGGSMSGEVVDELAAVEVRGDPYLQNITFFLEYLFLAGHSGSIIIN